jgi:transcriptional regulator of arginine metabolism
MMNGRKLTLEAGAADRRKAIREIVAGRPVGSQAELVAFLLDRGHAVTQATISRDIAELGLVKVSRGDRHVYISTDDLGPRPAARQATDDRLRRILADIPVRVGRSGLILLLTGTPGTAGTIAQAIDESTLTEQEGTLAGDNTLLVLFADETRLEGWLERFQAIQAQSAPEVPQ